MSETKNRKELQREYSKAGTENRSIAKAPHGMPGSKKTVGRTLRLHPHFFVTPDRSGSPWRMIYSLFFRTSAGVILPSFLTRIAVIT